MKPLPNVKQGTDYDCGLAVVQSVLMGYGWSRAVAELEVREIPCDPHYGTRPEAIEAHLRNHFCTISGEMTIGDLRHFVRQGRPVICAVEDHWIVVDAVERNAVIYMDPATGRHERKTLAKFAAWWHDQHRFVAFGNLGICPWTK